LHLQIGLVLSLALVLTAARISFQSGEGLEIEKEQETVDLKQVQQTQHERTPPAPPRPPVPQVVPNEEIVGPPTPDFDVSRDLDAPLDQSTGSPSPSPDPPSSDEVFVEVQQRPDCGGIQSLRKKTRYPPAARKPDLDGRVFVQFVVDENGQVTNPRVVRGVHEVLNQAALRTVRRLDCTPDKQRSQPVKVRMTMPVIFALDDDA
jgi:protein TonB